MSAPPNAGHTAVGSGQTAGWVREHGSSLLDYATYRLGAAKAADAAASALGESRRLTAPDGVSERALLLAALRRGCLADPSCRAAYHPASGPGLPDEELLERAWALIDPLGVETLLLMFRHELSLRDLAYVLGLPEGEVHRLATRTQDLIETLLSGLEALARGRPTCPELQPLAAAAFPDEPGARTDQARTDLLTHMIECSACNRPFNIHYTVPQMVDHVPLAPLPADKREELLLLLPAAPLPPPSLPALPPLPRQAEKAARDRKPATHRVRLPAAPATGQDTPLYNALASQVWAREVLSPTDDATAPQQAVRAGSDAAKTDTAKTDTAKTDTAKTDTARTDAAGTDTALSHPADIRAADTAPVPVRAEPTAESSVRSGSRLPEALAAAGARTRRTAVKVAIMLVAGTAGMLTGLQILGPAQDQAPGSAFQSAPASAGAVGGLTLPAEVKLDGFGRGALTLTISGEPVAWRITVPGVTVTPSTGTLAQGDPMVVRLRAQRVRLWCGDPAPAEALLTVRGTEGPADSTSTRVRWHTC